MDEELERMLKATRARVSETISSTEVVLAYWSAMKQKPAEYKETMANMESLLRQLEAWELKSLKNANAADETKISDLAEFIRIYDHFKKVFG